MGVGRFFAAGVVAGAVTVASRAAFGLLSHDQGQRWIRTNHRGDPISLYEGPAVAAGVVAGTLAAGALAQDRAISRGSVATAVAVTSAATFGLIDDLCEDTSQRSKGLRGHLGALSRGHLTTGGLKVLGIGAGAAGAAAIIGAGRRPVGDWVIDTALIAGSANLVNLLDLRPGRALKTSSGGALIGLLTHQDPSLGAVAGAAGAAWPGDLDERDMLGDCGANALGAALGASLAAHGSRGARVVTTAVIIGLTVASERVSFSRVIESTPWLQRVDLWGRRAASSASSSECAPGDGVPAAREG